MCRSSRLCPQAVRVEVPHSTGLREARLLPQSHILSLLGLRGGTGREGDARFPGLGRRGQPLQGSRACGRR